MKKLFAAFALAMAMCTGASAQKSEFFFQGGLPTLTGSTSIPPVTYSADFEFYDLGLGMNSYLPFSQKTPFYFMIGMNFMYGHTQSDARIPTSYYTLLRLPLSLMYSCEVNKNISIEPYAGLNFSYFLTGDSKQEGRYIVTQSSVSWFPHAKRFNQGYQFGVNVDLNQLVLGVEYEHDLSVFDSDNEEGQKVDYKWHAVTFKLGFRFK